MFKGLLKILMVTAFFLISVPGFAGGETVAKVSQEMFTISNAWMLIAAALVFIMHLGFATLESGLTRAKNTINILYKNVMIVAIGLLAYALIGFSLMYNGDAWIIGKVFGCAGFGLACPEGAAGAIAYNNGTYTYWTDFIFQGMFAATAATIVSGAVAERIKLSSFMIFSAVYVALVYPFLGNQTLRPANYCMRVHFSIA